jgi:hypothetical protein
MVLYSMIGVIALMAVTLFVLIIVYGVLVAGKKKVLSVVQPPVVSEPVLTNRQQVVEDKVAAIVAAYREAEAAKFRADAIEEVKAILK